MRLQEFLTGEQPLYFIQRYEPDDFLAELRRRYWFVGTSDEVIEQLQEWARLGIQHVMLQTLDLNDTDQVEAIARDVLPYL